jgi:hypothetical protein
LRVGWGSRQRVNGAVEQEAETEEEECEPEDVVEEIEIVAAGAPEIGHYDGIPCLLDIGVGLATHGLELESM